LHDEDEKLAEEYIDLLGGFEVVELAKKVSREIDVNGLCWLYLQRGMTKAEAGADGTKTALTTADGEMMALRAAGTGVEPTRNGVSRAAHPCGDRKSAESLDSIGLASAPLRKRVCN
jgi:hypothetical protein